MMVENQQRESIPLTSPYNNLHIAINNLTTHGNREKNARVVKLAEQLRDKLVRFERGVDQCREQKCQFMDKFLKVLEQHGGQLDIETTRLVNALYPCLYSTVFFNRDHLLQFSLFQDKQSECIADRPHAKLKR